MIDRCLSIFLHPAPSLITPPCSCLHDCRWFGVFCSGGARYDAKMDGSNARVGTAIVFKDKAKLFAAAMEASNDKSLVAKSFVPHWEQEVSSHGRACVAFSMDACVPRACRRSARARVCVLAHAAACVVRNSSVCCADTRGLWYCARAAGA